MDLDFILTTVVYLAVILYIHYLLRDAEHHHSALKKIEDNESTDDVLCKSEEKSNDTHDENHDENQNKKIEKKVDLIIDENEINDILSNDAKNDFMKYLDVEDFDKGSNYQELLKPLQENTIEVSETDTTSQLDKFFTNIKDEQYNFNPVPTESPESTDLMADKVLLNTKSDEVFAFDEFDNAFSTF
tara:strand:- start:117 stop:677 length:561 start_codon:yes stop_codon:yes gene_type:complete